MNLSIDITTLNDEQLTAMALIAPEAVKAEQLRRRSYPSLDDAMTALRLAKLKLDTFIENIRKTQSVKGVMDTGIQETLDRFFVTAQLNDLPMGKAPLAQVSEPAPVTQPTE